ncbi:hypothetical protein IMG5_194820 [Ichthyophthirius multifiliis]|uniref:Uncharacterized protein n=1 Tax=Ichthyophthirius multifiliis TaxID=5932 RepID=G0R4U5_ICHMU|nr:hypothetical protein IMG5_194820 [Ichthyophthirius multifiliis]EGR27533.1 hypothetical protein IMG5_194820 [Ichthyophthirius multifiliis]|eukprot:XP_004024985.1 hypothetical protein IMG5_194820 [Ichthyophthirius multifiliis]
MIYPKNHNNQSKLQNKINFSYLQREQLKEVLQQKFEMKYNKQNREIIKQQLDNYIKHTQNINSKGINLLEEIIMKQINQKKYNSNHIQNNEKEKKLISQKEENQMELTKTKIKTKSEELDKYQTQLELQNNNSNNNIQQPKLENIDLKKLKREENEFLDINKYNKYLNEKQQELLKLKKYQQIQKFKEDLDNQIKEKNIQKEQNKIEDLIYFENLKLQIAKYDEKQLERLKKIQELKTNENLFRSQQIQDIKKSKKQNYKEKRILDGLFIQKAKDELEYELQCIKQKKESNKKNGEKLQQENIEKQIKLKEKIKQEKLQSIQQMKDHQKKLENQETKRQKEIQDRDEKIKKYQQENKRIENQKEKKIWAIYERQQKYILRNEKKILQDMIEQKIKKKNKKNQCVIIYKIKYMKKIYIFKKLKQKIRDCLRFKK